MSVNEYKPPSKRDVDEPHVVADRLIRHSNGATKTHVGDFRVYFDGFDFVTFVDRSIPVRRHDEVLTIKDGSTRAHGIVAQARQYDETDETEFYTIPFTEEIEY